VLLQDFVRVFADALWSADARSPVQGKYAPGVGPHTESRTIDLALAQVPPDAGWASSVRREVPYPNSSELCDVVMPGEWAMEFKLMRMLRNNGGVEPTMVAHILSPYEGSAVTDCIKLAGSNFAERRAVVIIAYDYDDYPLEPLTAAFEAVAAQHVELGTRAEAPFDGLGHAHHRRGKVMAWEVRG
jgi:hypothetical protein